MQEVFFGGADEKDSSVLIAVHPFNGLGATAYLFSRVTRWVLYAFLSTTYARLSLISRFG